jgi:hypothetical protein
VKKIERKAELVPPILAIVAALTGALAGVANYMVGKWPLSIVWGVAVVAWSATAVLGFRTRSSRIRTDQTWAEIRKRRMRWVQR